MKIACFILIKANSERVAEKNFRVLNGKKLYEYICEHIAKAKVFDDVYVDTNSVEITEYAKSIGFLPIELKPELALNTANGNNLLVYHGEIFPNYDYYFQMFATAPYLQPESIRSCVDMLLNSEEYDSCLTATSNHGFYWLEGNPVNYWPGILPRSQDMSPVIEETTGLYGISKESLTKTSHTLLVWEVLVNKFEAVDINTEEDWKVAEYVGKVIYGFEGYCPNIFQITS